MAKTAADAVKVKIAESFATLWYLHIHSKRAKGGKDHSGRYFFESVDTNPIQAPTHVELLRSEIPSAIEPVDS